MNKINPLHIIALVLVLILFLLVQIHHAKKELEEEKKLFLQTKELALKTKAYKELYDQKNKKRLERILLQPYFKKAGVHFTGTTNGYSITASSLKLSVLNALIDKIFNGAYNIQKLEIKRVDAKHASLQLEIQW